MWHDHDVEGLVRENDALRASRSAELDTAWPIAVAALCIWREARGEPYAAKLAVARVLHERVRDPRWPDTLDGVALQAKQFSCFNPDDPNAVKLPKRTAPADWRAFSDSWRAVLDTTTPNAVEGANHYFDSSLVHPPSWALKMEYKGRIGNLIFYKG